MSSLIDDVRIYKRTVKPKVFVLQKKTRGLAAWNSGHPSLFDTAIESIYFSKNGVLKSKIDIFSVSI